MDLSYHSLTKMFDIQKYRSSPLIQMKCDLIKDTHPSEYPMYYKASKILDYVHKLIETNQLEPNDRVIDSMIQKMTFPSVDLKQSIEPVVQAYNNPITHGRLNTIKRVTQLQNIHLNSFFRQYPSSSTDFDIVLPREIMHVSSIRLASIELPNTRLLISAKQQNNTFQIKIGAVLYDFTVPDGNYNPTTLENEINTLLSNQSVSLSFNLDAQYHTTLTASVPPFSFYPRSFGWLLGFRKTVYIDVDIVLSEGLYDLIGDRYLYLGVEDFQYNTNINNIVCLDKSYVDKSILAKIPTNDEKYALIIYDTDPLSKKRIYNGPVTLKKFHITLLDKFCKVVDLQYMDFSFTLELELIYENF